MIFSFRQNYPPSNIIFLYSVKHFCEEYRSVMERKIKLVQVQKIRMSQVIRYTIYSASIFVYAFMLYLTISTIAVREKEMKAGSSAAYHDRGH